MNFELSKEQQEIKERAAEFADRRWFLMLRSGTGRPSFSGEMGHISRACIVA